MVAAAPADEGQRRQPAVTPGAVVEDLIRQRSGAGVVVRNDRRRKRPRQIEIHGRHPRLLTKLGNFIRVRRPGRYHPIHLPGEHRLHRFDLQLRATTGTGDNRQQTALARHLFKAFRNGAEVTVVVFGNNHADHMRFFTAQHAGLAVYRVALLFSNPRHLFRKFGADTPFFPVAIEDCTDRAGRNAGQFRQIVDSDFFHFPNLRHKFISLLISPLAQSMKLAQH